MMWKEIKNLWVDFSLPAKENFPKNPKARKQFSIGEKHSELNVVKCTVADDNGWVTDCVFIQREMGEK